MQIENIREYYHANITLIQSLNYASKICVSLKEYIEETLLLPITKIEKYRSDKLID